MALNSLWTRSPRPRDPSSPPWAPGLGVYFVLALSVALNSFWISDGAWRSSRKTGAPPPASLPSVIPPPPPPPPISPAGKLAVNGQPCGSRKNEEAVEYLRNIVLIVNINHESIARTTVQVLGAVYRRYFDHVVFIAATEDKEAGIEARGHDPLRVNWYWAYYYFPKIVAQYPHADGYLWTDDDVVVNYWNLVGANKSRIWLPDLPRCGICQTFVPFNEDLIEDSWDGWSAEPATRRGAMLALSRCDLKYIYQYRKSIWPRREGYNKRLVDCFYIPSRLAGQFAFDLVPLFREHGVWSQVAIPMMFHCLESPANYDPVLSNIGYRWERDIQKDPFRYWNTNVSAYHPWKLSSPDLRRRSLEVLSRGDPCLANITLPEDHSPPSSMSPS